MSPLNSTNYGHLLYYIASILHSRHRLENRILGRGLKNKQLSHQNSKEEQRKEEQRNQTYTFTVNGQINLASDEKN
jgi:hypothetical protein